MAQSHNIPVRCFFFDYPKDLSFHLNNLRSVNIFRTHNTKAVPDVVIHTYYKNLEEPSLAEGFEEVKKISLIPGPFSSPKDEEIFYMHSS
jgi:hypothetical protein